MFAIGGQKHAAELTAMTYGATILKERNFLRLMCEICRQTKQKHSRFCAAVIAMRGGGYPKVGWPCRSSSHQDRVFRSCFAQQSLFLDKCEVAPSMRGVRSGTKQTSRWMLFSSE